MRCLWMFLRGIAWTVETQHDRCWVAGAMTTLGLCLVFLAVVMYFAPP